MDVEQLFTSMVSFKCPICDSYVSEDVEVPELDFSAEKMSDMSVDGFAEVQCENCQTNFTGDVFVSAGETYFQFEEPVAFEVHGEMPFFEPIVDHPEVVAREALKALAGAIGKVPSPRKDPQFGNRLIFTGTVSVLEAYLADTLIKAVYYSDCKCSLLIDSVIDKKRKEKPRWASGGLSKQKVIKGLQEVTFHNPKVANSCFAPVFGFAPFDDDKFMFNGCDLKDLRNACVHRNGYVLGEGIDGEERERHSEFTDVFVSEVIECIRGMIEGIEIKLNLDDDFGSLLGGSDFSDCSDF